MFCKRKASEIFRKHYEKPWAEYCRTTDWLRWPVKNSEFKEHVRHEAAWEYEWAIAEMRDRARAIWLA